MQPFEIALSWRRDSQADRETPKFWVTHRSLKKRKGMKIRDRSGASLAETVKAAGLRALELIDCLTRFVGMHIIIVALEMACILHVVDNHVFTLWRSSAGRRVPGIRKFCSSSSREQISALRDLSRDRSHQSTEYVHTCSSSSPSPGGVMRKVEDFASKTTDTSQIPVPIHLLERPRVSSSTEGGYALQMSENDDS